MSLPSSVSMISSLRVTLLAALAGGGFLLVSGCGGQPPPSTEASIPTLHASAPAADDYIHVPAQAGGRLEMNLNYSHSKITDAELRALPIHDAVTKLDLSYTAITDHGLKNIARGRNIEELILVSTKVTNACLPHLKQMPSLRNCPMSQTAVSTEGQLDLLQFLSNRPQTSAGGQPQ